MTAGAVVLTPEVAGAGAELAEAAELAGVTIGEAAAPVANGTKLAGIELADDAGGAVLLAAESVEAELADGAELGVAAAGADPVEAGAELADEVAAA